ncbi:MAG TPA: DUF2092 domain-containing protein [Armatimonadetes bacterium]|nr:DUF2092 domain-containing protein [Armatimonadota bacterium]
MINVQFVTASTQFIIRMVNIVNCQNCNAELPEDATECPQCNAPTEPSAGVSKPAKERRRSLAKMIALGIAIVVLTGAFGAFAVFLLRPTPLRILMRTAQIYREMQAVHIEAKLTIEPFMSVPINFAITLKRPNLMRGTLKVPGPLPGLDTSVVAVSDGKQMYAAIEAWNQYQVEEAPKSLMDVWARFKPAGSRTDHRDNIAIALFAGVDVFKQLEKSEFLPDEVIETHLCRVLKLEYRDGLKQKVWIGKQDGYIWKTATRIQVRAPTIPQPVELILAQTFSKITPNPKISKSAFSYRPPKGARKVTAFEPPNAEEMRERLRKMQEELRRQGGSMRLPDESKR